jgi:8-oxo-dGTP diphosphatase
MCPVDTNELEGYDASVFERPSVTVDVVALMIRGGTLHVLLIRRGVAPFRGAWALPGGFVQMTEDLDDAARRELAEETAIRAPITYLEQLYTFGKPGRDPRTRVISVAYYALFPDPASGLPDAPGEPHGGTDATEAVWFPIDALPPLAFDHADILALALSRLRAKLGYSSVAYALLPEEFTLTELQTVYEIILGRDLDKRNFRKKLLASEILEATPRQRRDGAHRPALLYRFLRREAAVLE